jgi:predicted N-acetyltransferase YhbS
MTLRLLPGTLADAKECGRIQYEAFKSIAEHHNFPPDFPSAAVATELVTMLLSHPRFYAVVAEVDGRTVGCNFLDERSAIAGIGPVSVDPPVMNAAIGRQLMQAVMDRAAVQRFPGVRLLQIAWHYRSLALYAKLGFEIRETISGLQGPPLYLTVPGYEVRPAREEDVPACNRSALVFTGTTVPGKSPMPFATGPQTSSNALAGSPATRLQSVGSITPLARRMMT